MYFVFIFVCYLYYIYIFFTKHILYPLEVFIKLFNIEFLRVFIIYILWQCRVDVIINNIRIFSTFFIPEITTRIKICPVSCIFCVRSHNTKAVIIKSSSYLYSAQSCHINGHFERYISYQHHIKLVQCARYILEYSNTLSYIPYNVQNIFQNSNT